MTFLIDVFNYVAIVNFSHCPSRLFLTSVSQQRNKANPQWPLRGTDPNYPMYYVSWEEASEFCRILSRKTGRTYRLPTEAEWEYAARGGQKSDGTKYSGSNLIDFAGWYSGNSANSAHSVGTKTSNELSIYDMSGNVREWCCDWYAGAYDRSQTDNPAGPVSGSYVSFVAVVGIAMPRAVVCRIGSTILLITATAIMVFVLCACPSLSEMDFRINRLSTCLYRRK